MNKKLSQRLWSYMMRAKKELFKGLIFLSIMTVLQLLSPAIIGRIIDTEFVKMEESGIFAVKNIALLLTGYVISGILQAIFRYLNSMSFMSTANKIATEIRHDVFFHVERLPQNYFDNISAGKVISRITNDTNALKTFFQTALGEILTSAVYILVMAFVLFFTNKIFILFVIVPIIILSVIIYFYDKKSRVYNKNYRQTLSIINSDINENIKGMEEIKSFNVEKNVLEEFKSVSEENYESGINIERLDSFVGLNSTQTLGNLNVFIILFLFGMMKIKNVPGFSVGIMYILLDYTQRIYNAANHIMERLRDIEKSITAAEHIFEILDKDIEESASQNSVKINGDVEFKNVSFYYKDEDFVLKDINFKVESGKTLALVGQTGSGKSSIINLLFRFYTEQRGEILFDGINANEFSISDLRKNMAIVLQEPFLYTGTIRENITLGRNFDDKKVLESLFAVGGENLYNHLRNGLDTRISEGGGELSQGEKQIITFARAIISEPEILVLDEATSSIDSETEQFIQIGLDKLKEGRTTFIVAHRLSTIKDADEILVLSFGKIIERGNHFELMEKKGVYYDMLMKENENKL